MVRAPPFDCRLFDVLAVCYRGYSFSLSTF
jgi:hypothetical protein